MTALTNFPELLSLAIVYSIAAGAVCYILLRIVLWLGQRSGSLLKYHISNACLVIMFVAFLWPFRDLQLSKSNSVNIGQETKIIPLTENRAHAATLQMVPASTAIKPEANTKASADETKTIYPQHKSILSVAILKINESSNIILVIYLAGLLFFSCRLLASYMYSRSLKRSGISAATEQWLGSLQFAMSKLNMARDIRIFFSSRAIAPCIIGHGKAVILIPIALSTQLSTEQAEAILLHELAHLKHYDYYINIAMQVINCLLFFNPFVWLTIKKCKQYREQACDEITTREERSLALAESLAFIAENTSKRSALTLMLKENKYKLLARIQNLLGGSKREGRNYGSLGVLLIPLLLSVCMVLYSTNIFSQKKDDLKTRLEKVSQEMFDEGNPRYVIVDALMDSLVAITPTIGLPMADTSFERRNVNTDMFFDFVLRNSNEFFINFTKLRGRTMHKYADKMERFLSRFGETNRPVHVVYFNHDTLSLEKIFDPRSRFRKFSMSDRIYAGVYTAARKTIVKHLIDDKLLDPSAVTVAISFNKPGIKIDGILLDERLQNKYHLLFEKEYGVDYNDLGILTSYEWDFGRSAKEYLAKTTGKTIIKKIPMTEDIQNKLALISSQMFSEGNERYIIVDAIVDRLSPLYEISELQMNDTVTSAYESIVFPSYEAGFSGGNAWVGKENIDDATSHKYAKKMRLFLSNLKEPNDTIDVRCVILVKYKSDKALSFEEILDPSSPFRKLNTVDRNAAGIYTLARKKMIKHFLDDKLIAPTDDKLNITYGNSDIIINDKTLSGALKKKYHDLLQNEYGVNLSHDTYSGVWNMKSGAREYIRGTAPSKKNDDKKTGSNFPEAKHAPDWPQIPMSHIAWRKRCWKDIDVNANGNSAFGAAAIPSDRQLYNILVNGVKSGKYKAYATKNDKFTTELTDEEFLKIASKNFTVTKFRIKEDSVYFKREDIPTSRILGLSPIVKTIGPKGEETETPLFWLY